MKERKPVSDIFHLHIVRYDVSLDSSRKLFAHFLVGINHEGIRVRGNENIRVEFSFCAQDRSLNRETCGRFSQVVADLPVEKTRGVRSRNAQLQTGRKVKKCAALGIEKPRHGDASLKLNLPSVAAKSPPTFHEALRLALLGQATRVKRLVRR